MQRSDLVQTCVVFFAFCGSNDAEYGRPFAKRLDMDPNMPNFTKRRIFNKKLNPDMSCACPDLGSGCPGTKDLSSGCPGIQWLSRNAGPVQCLSMKRNPFRKRIPFFYLESDRLICYFRKCSSLSIPEKQISHVISKCHFLLLCQKISSR